MKTRSLAAAVLCALLLTVPPQAGAAGKETRIRTSMGTIVMTPHRELGVPEAADCFREGLAAVKVDGKWGYLTPGGEWQIEPCYEEARGFSAGMASVRLDGKWGCVDRDGNLRVDFLYDDMADAFADGRKAVCRGGLWGYIDESGREAVLPRWLHARTFSEGLAAAADQETRGYIRPDGSWAILLKATGESLAAAADAVRIGDPENAESLSWEEMGDFSDGLAQIRLKDAYVYINQAGAEAFRMASAGTAFSEGLAARQDPETGLYGFVSTEGETVTEAVWEAADAFREGLAPVAVREHKRLIWGYIDTEGNKVGKIQWARAGRFRNGTAVVAGRGGRMGMVDPNGKTVLKDEWKILTDFSEDYALGLKGKVFFILQNVSAVE